MKNRLVYHRKKDTGVTYVYEVYEEYWDKEKKQMRSKQRCIGKLDPDTQEIIPSKRYVASAESKDEAITASTSVTGPALLLDKIATDTGLIDVLRMASPNHYQEILSLAWYIVSTGNTLSNADVWCKNHETPSRQNLSSQRISELLSKITTDERLSFFKQWGKRISEDDYLCYDITSVSSYSRQNEYVRYGYNRDHERIPQINLGLVYAQKSFLPVAYRELNGSISDVSTLNYLLGMFDKLEFPHLHLVMDRGFYSKSNIDDLMKGGHNFTIGTPSHLKWVRNKIDESRDEMYGPNGYRKIGDEILYVHTHLLSWGENKRRCYLQLYFNNKVAAEAKDDFISLLLQYKQELEDGRPILEHQDAYDKFFIIKRTPKRGLKVTYNEAAIEAQQNNYKGFFAILTTKFKDPVEALKVYREKDAVEKSFDDLKNGLDMKRLHVHTSERMKSRLFIQFIALIFISQIRKTSKEKLAGKSYSAKRLIQELESLTTIHYTNKYKDRLTEISKSQREILEAFGIDIHTL